MARHAERFALLGLLVGLAACSGASAAPADAGPVDAGLVDAGRPDAGQVDAGQVDAGPADAGPDAGLACASQCDCPSHTLCTIDRVCVGEPEVDACDPDGGCPCGQPCLGGWCGPLVGSLTPCRGQCDCGVLEVCAGGRCATAPRAYYESGDTECKTTADCAACGEKVCVGQYLCATPDRCTDDDACFDDLGGGQECRCPDGSRTVNGSTFACDGNDGTLGRCQAISGQGFFAAAPLALPPFSERTGLPPPVCRGPGVDGGAPEGAVQVQGLTATPGQAVFYAEVRSSSSDHDFSGPGLTLTGPSGASTSAHFATVARDRYVIVMPLDLSGQTSFNGTWTLCEGYFDATQSITLDRWGIYFQ